MALDGRGSRLRKVDRLVSRDLRETKKMDRGWKMNQNRMWKREPMKVRVRK